MKEKEDLLCKLKQLEIFSNLQPYNYSIENKIFIIQSKINNDYSNTVLPSSLEINKSIIKLIKTNISSFNQEILNYNLINIVNIRKLIKVIKEIKYNIEYGNEIIECCKITNTSFPLSIYDKIDGYKQIKKTLIRNYNKIKHGENNILDI